MSAADEAYRAAEVAIERAWAKDEKRLIFDSEEFRALERIPREIVELKWLQHLDLKNTLITDLAMLGELAELQHLDLVNTKITDLAPLAGMTGLQTLKLDNTQITDFAPLAGLIGLRALGLSNTQIKDLTQLVALTDLKRIWINDTQISDLTPLGGMTGLQLISFNNSRVNDLGPLAGLVELLGLFLNNTQVIDLRPIAKLEKISRVGLVGHEGGVIILDQYLGFQNTYATQRDARLAELANASEPERTRETLAYLRTLPHWPEPYTPAATTDGSPPQPIGGIPDAPDPDQVPRLVLTADARIDLPPILATEAELADPIRKRLYDRLPTALDALLRYSNRFPELDSPARALRELLEVPFSEADFLLMHLEIDALTDIRESQSNRPENDKLDVDCMNALASVLRIAPPITMGHPDIDLLEDRGRQYQRSRIPESAAAAEKQIVRGLDKNDLATERTQEFARRTAMASDGGRVAELRRGFTKNVVLIMYFMTEQTTAAATGYVFGSVTVSAAQFLLVHKDAILATAPTWGQSGFAWVQYVMIQAQRIIDEAHGKA
jgi:internalin A